MSYQNNRRSKIPSQNGVFLAPPDKSLIILTWFLVVIGMLAVFSASAPRSMDECGHPFRYFGVQFISMIMGAVCLLGFQNYDYKKLKNKAVPFAWIVIFLLCLVAFTPLGVEVNGARRWLNLGMQVQPSEFAKISVVLLLACAFHEDSVLFSATKIVKYYLPILIMLALIKIQPNLSMIILLFLTSVVMYITAHKSFFKIMFCAITGGIGLGAFAMLFASKFLQPYQMQRIITWRNPELDALGNGYNILQSLYAFASGGIAGMGFGNSVAKRAWLPEGHTDFIFSVIAEEFGFIGCAFLVGLFLAFLHRGLTISSKCTNMFGKLLAIGLTFAIWVQSFLNMSVTSGLVPATGVTLPFVSYGGTSLIVTLSMVGILLNISRKRIIKIRNYDNARR